MQNAKDSFYIALRDRLAVLTPTRVMEVRAVQRPAILVEEAEAPAKEMPNNAFVLRWTKIAAMQHLPSPLISMECEVHYATSGSVTGAGLDRGRALAEMDRELLNILRPLCTPKLSYASTPALPLKSMVFWTEPTLAALERQRNQLLRVATVTVCSFQEAGEL